MLLRERDMLCVGQHQIGNGHGFGNGIQGVQARSHSHKDVFHNSVTIFVCFHKRDCRRHKNYATMEGTRHTQLVRSQENLVQSVLQTIVQCHKLQAGELELLALVCSVNEHICVLLIDQAIRVLRKGGLQGPRFVRQRRTTNDPPTRTKKEENQTHRQKIPSLGLELHLEVGDQKQLLVAWDQLMDVCRENKGQKTN